MAPRAALLLLSLLLSLPGHAALRLGEAKPLGRDTIAPGGAGVTFRAVETSYGYLAVWDRGESLVAARITHDGAPLDDPPLVLGPQLRLISQPATDGSDVIVAHGQFVSRRPIWQIQRVAANGEVTHLLQVPDLLAVVWTGRNYIAFLGNCTPREALQFDRNGAVLQSVALRVPGRSCDGQLSSFIYRDPSGALQLVYQDGLAASTGDYAVKRVALTDANGDPVASPEPQPLEAAPTSYIRAVAATHEALFLLASNVVYVLDHAGRQLAPPVAVETTFGVMTVSGREAIVADGGLTTDIRAWRISPEGRRLAMAVGRVSTTQKDEIAIRPAPGGAALFWIERDPGRNRATLLMTRLGRGPLQRMHVPVPLSRGTPLIRDLTAAAHANGMLAVWIQFGVLGSEVRSARLDSSGEQLGPSQHLFNADSLRMASNGDVAMLVFRQGTQWSAQLMDHDGRLTGEPIDLGTSSVQSVGWDGGAFVIHTLDRFGHWGWRFDAAGQRLTSSRVLFAFETSPIAALAVSPRGALFAYLYAINRLAVFVRTLTRELEPATPSREAAIIDPLAIQAVWTGSEYVVAFANSSIRIVRVSADGEPRGDGFGEFVAPYSGGAWRIGLASFGSVVVATERVVADPATGSAASLPAGTSPAAIVTTRDNRTWLFHTVQTSGASAREIFFE